MIPAIPLNAVVDLAAVILVSGAVFWLQCRYRFLQYLFFLRLPILHASILVLLPLALLTRAFGNLFVTTPLQLVSVAFMLVISTWAVTTAWGLVFVGAAPRFRLKFQQPDFGQEQDWDRDPRPNRLHGVFGTAARRAYFVPLLLSAPTLIASAWQSSAPWWQAALAAAAGIGFAFVLREVALWLGRGFGRWLYRPQTSLPAARALNLRLRVREAPYRLSESRVGRSLLSAFTGGYAVLSDDDPAASGTPLEESASSFSHWRAVALAVMALSVYIAGAFVLNPARSGFFVEHTPALAYVLLVVTLLGLVLP
ncbi:MAG: hypothetical protein ACRD15_16220, partial [Vicinamibacterales bacterium]